jgi:hypothetical protein
VNSAHCAACYSLQESSLRTLFNMSKRKRNKTSRFANKNFVRCSKKNGFPRSLKQKSCLRTTDIFINREADDVVCSICSEANALSEFTSDKKWDEWKLD